MKIKISNKCFIEQFDDESIVLNIETNKYHSINNTGAKIVNELRDKIMPLDIFKKKIKELYTDLTTEEIDQFIENMLDRKIFIGSWNKKFAI